MATAPPLHFLSALLPEDTASDIKAVWLKAHDSVSPCCGKDPLFTPLGITSDMELIVKCTRCGEDLILKAQLGQVFTWVWGDGQEVVWDVDGLLSHLTDRHNKDGFQIPAKWIPSWWVDFWCEQNPDAVDPASLDDPNIRDIPVILVNHPGFTDEEIAAMGDDPVEPVPIDGWHKIHRAKRDGTKLKGVLLPREIEKPFRLYTGKAGGFNPNHIIRS